MVLGDPAFFLAIAIFLAVVGYFVWVERKEKEKRLENRIKFLEDRVKQKNELSYGYKYKCGYCSHFKADNCPREESSYNSEPCDTFKLIE
jgi:hypothetical protein